MKSLRRLWPHERRFYLWALGSVVGITFAAMADLLLPMLLAKIVDLGIGTGSSQQVWNIGMQMLLVAVITVIGGAFGNYCAAQLGTEFARQKRKEVFGKVQTFSLEEMDEFGTASLITRSTNDIQQVQQFIMMLVRMFVRSPILMVGGVFMALSHSPRLAAPLIISLPVILLIVFLISRYVVPMFSVIQEKIDDVNRVLREQITGIRVIRAFGTEEHEEDRFDDISMDYTRTSLKMMRVTSTMGPLLTIVTNATVVAILLLSARDVNAGLLLDDGTTLAVVQYVMQIMFSLVMMSMMFIAYPRAVASAERIAAVLDRKPEITDLKTVKTPDENTKGTLEFRGVSFTFPDAERPTLENINFRINQGDKLAIIGSTGSGKSTLLRLIMRFYDVTQGAILLDGVDIREMSQKDLRNRLGYVTQTSQLFSGTIADNLNQGKEEATPEEMKKAASISQALEFISQEEGELEAHVAQMGTNYSGGQKQRLSITRAVVRQPEILLLDDSFSALDAATDLALRQALDKEMGDTTQVTVAQRVASIAQSDEILVLEHGQVVGQGTHKELMETCQVYREIADSQFSEGEVAV